MVFKVGETVVYPHHGAALIEAIETRTIKGEERKYLVLKVAQGDLTVRVPAENAEVVGVRDVVGQEGLDRVFEVLRAPHTEEPTNWSRRYKANGEKLASGDVNKVAEVVRDLWRRDKERGLSAGEKRMLATARQIVVIAPAEFAPRYVELTAADPLVTVVAGGRTRQDSVRLGLGVLPDDVDVVLVHDAARPFVPAHTIARVLAAIEDGADAVVPAVPVADTIKRVSADGLVLGTVERAELRAAQTPQGFRRGPLSAAHQYA